VKTNTVLMELGHHKHQHVRVIWVTLVLIVKHAALQVKLDQIVKLKHADQTLTIALCMACALVMEYAHATMDILERYVKQKIDVEIRMAERVIPMVYVSTIWIGVFVMRGGWVKPVIKGHV
jgi:hypothetical protein